jgi:hypothetical protein
VAALQGGALVVHFTNRKNAPLLFSARLGTRPRPSLAGPPSTGATGADSYSKMPDYSDSMSIRQLVDLVAYLKSLTGSGHHDGHAGMGKMKM